MSLKPKWKLHRDIGLSENVNFAIVNEILSVKSFRRFAFGGGFANLMNFYIARRVSEREREARRVD